MLITRDGKIYRLTSKELYEAYREVKRQDTEEDIKLRMEEMIEGGDIPENAIAPDPETFERMLEGHDLYWDIYWGVMTEAIKNENI